MTVSMTTGVRGYTKSGFALKAAQYVRLASEGRKWFCVLHLGQRGRNAAPRRAAISHVFHSEHVKRQTTSARLWHYLLSRAIFETQTRPHTCHVFHGVTFMTTESAQYMILEQKKNPKTNCRQMLPSEDEGWNNEWLLPVSAEDSVMLMLMQSLELYTCEWLLFSMIKQLFPTRKRQPCYCVTGEKPQCWQWRSGEKCLDW